MNELLRNIVRAQELLQSGASQGADHVLETAAEYAKSAESLINAQTGSMSGMHLKIKELTADVDMYKDRMTYWENRARTYEKLLIELGELPDDTLDTLRAHGLEDHLTGSDQDA